MRVCFEAERQFGEMAKPLCDDTKKLEETARPGCFVLLLLKNLVKSGWFYIKF